MNGGFLYRFLDKDENVLYIGQTKDINRRITDEHFVEGHLPALCYESVEKIEFVEVPTSSERKAYEILLINQFSPKYNTEFMDGVFLDVSLPVFNWSRLDEKAMKEIKRRYKRMANVSDVLARHLELRESDISNVISTGFRFIDRYHALSPRQLTLLCGHAMSGKTSLALKISLNSMLHKSDCSILYVNLKDSDSRLAEQMLSISTGIELTKRQFSDEEWKSIADGLSRIAHCNITFANLLDTENTIHAIINCIRASEYNLVIIDDVNSIETDNQYSIDKTRSIMRTLKAVAIERGLSLLALYTLKRNKRADGRPVIDDLEHESLISYPDGICSIYQKSSDDSSEHSPWTHELLSMKNYEMKPLASILHCTAIGLCDVAFEEDGL